MSEKLSKLKDFDQAWKEKEEKGYPFKVKGKEYLLPASIPAKCMLEALRMEKEYGGDAAIPLKETIPLAIDVIGKDQVDEMLADGITVEELNDILEWAYKTLNPVEEGDSGNVETETETEKETEKDDD